MGDPKRDQLQVKQKRAVLAAVITPDDPLSKEHALDELKGLVETAGVMVVGELIQNRQNPHPAHCLGTGKLEELAELAKATDAELIIFDNNLSPAQGRNLEEQTGTVIVDRSEVILDIFASNARTYEAKLQVELAQLLYFRPRLKRLWTHLERIEGGVGAGRGPGEKQLETDRRLLDRRVAELKRKLGEVEGRRRRAVDARDENPTVSLVGYTNAGKSTLMNALTGADVYVANKLFATLDTRTRKWSVPNWGELLLSDTVGFVRNLPHHLVASFRSTLEEARQADLLLHVVDASNPEAEEQIRTVYEVLEEIGVETDSVQLVFNKIDKAEAEGPSTLDILRREFPDAVSVSAATGRGIERLTELVTIRLGDGYVDAVIDTSAGNGKLLAFLAAHGVIQNRDYVDSRVRVEVRLPRTTADRIFADESLVDEDTKFELLSAKSGESLGDPLQPATHAASG
ncbi:GTPase HflX [Stratiformator vulcanicus]|uniref:GTPase HflX n=1 Tax=Stratiformator vulcanicus TaxID=2527980 RepID=A0A517QVR0_9PLAN|nr:GTPase HflX [Stratiformator vulcanicus]QDT35698.1 GTPase HflX [Stratiformator vulcanicus]